MKWVKYHLRQIVSATPLNFEELATVLCQIKTRLSSRSICAMSTDPNELEPLSPGHFLIGGGGTYGWQIMEQMTQSFGRWWSTEYLSRLQQRPKWHSAGKRIPVGDLIKDDQPPLLWKMARVLQLHRGSDTVTRVVTLKTVNYILQRPMAKLCQLPSIDPASTSN